MPSPTATYNVQIGTSAVNMGTLAASDIYTSVSKALESLCPKPTSNVPGTCNSTQSIPIKNVIFINDDRGNNINTKGTIEWGEVDISVASSSYDDTNTRDNMIKLAATTASGGANISLSCAEHKVVDCVSTSDNWSDQCLTDPSQPVAFEGSVCETGEFAGVQYYDGHQETAKGWLDAEWKFALRSKGLFDCAAILDGLNTLLDFWRQSSLSRTLPRSNLSMRPLKQR
jgi:hypothetical protein